MVCFMCRFLEMEVRMFWRSRVEESCLQQRSFLSFVCVVIAFIPCQVATAQRCDTVVSNGGKNDAALWCPSARLRI